MTTTVARRTLLGAAASVLAMRASAEEAWPNRLIRIIVPYPPGGFNDALARLLADKLPALLGQNVIVENRAGAGGSVGAAGVARSAPDGYQFLLSNTATLVFNPLIYSNAGYDSRKDFTPLAVCARLSNALVVNPDVVPVKDVAGLLKFAREKPGGLNYGSSGVGSSPHLAMELFKRITKFEATHVPYRGSAPALTDLLGGNIGLMFDNVPNILAQLGPGGKLRGLAVTGSSRDPAVPDLPTLQEVGIEGYEMYVWFGLVGPPGLPDAIRQRMVEGIRTIMAMPETGERVRQLGAEVSFSGPDAMLAAIGAEHDRWAPVIRAANIKAD